MELRQLKTFSEVARTGSFIKASKELGYAQPTVTTHIKQLESEFKVRLFERLGHRIKLTQEGERLLNYVENIIKFSEDALTSVSSNGPLSGKIIIGANESFSVVRLPSILKSFKHKYPEVDINLKFGQINFIHEQLQNNTIDIAFFLTSKISYPDLIVETLNLEPVVVAAAPDHPLGSSKTLSVKNLERQDLIVTQENCAYRAMINDLLREAGVRPRSIIEINNIQAIKQLVMSGLGLTILPRASVESEVLQNLLVEIPLSPALPVYTQIAYHKDKWLSPTLINFLDQARSNYIAIDKEKFISK